VSLWIFKKSFSFV